MGIQETPSDREVGGDTGPVFEEGSAHYYRML